MADRSNYADKLISEDHTGILHEHHLLFGGDHRAFTPSGGESDDPNAGHGKLAIDSTGDQFWKSHRYRNDKGWIWSREMIDATYPNGYVPNVRIVEPASRSAELEAQMRTFKSVPPSAAEAYRGETFLHS